MKKLFTLFSILLIINGLSASTDTTTCNWKKRISRFDVYNNCDSHKNTVNIIGKIGLYQVNNCTKPVRRVWRLSGGSTGSTVIGNGENLYYKVTKNGTYTICLSLYDSCNNCDTVICKTVTINCLGCNWKNKIGGFDVWNNCDSNKNTKNIIGKFYLNQNYSCSKKLLRKWTVNNTVVGLGENLYYKVTQNGTYTVCMSVYDSCRQCDTTICKTTTINCFPAGCNWKSKIGGFEVWNNCDSNKSHKNIGGIFYLNSNYKCNKKYTRKWTVNNTVVGSGEHMYYQVYSNGVYKVCMTVYDSCNKCDTSICKEIKIECFDKCVLPTGWSQTNTCATYTFSGYKVPGSNNTPYTNPCHKYSWDFGDNTKASGKEVTHEYRKNGTYTVCMKVIDTCRHCDTMICKTVTITCLTNCNWKYKIGGFDVWNNCDSNKTHKNIIGKFYLNQNYNCSKKSVRKWTVNNTVVGYGEHLYYPVTKNGTYTVCMTVYDSCNKCDTTLCKTTTINCFPGCNWKSKVNDFYVASNCDSNKTPVYINGMFILNKNYKCTKRKVWKWTMNGVVSYSEKLHFKVTQNGTYNVCLWLYDSCNNCDTSFCKTVTVNCIKGGCNWKSKIGGFDVRTNCDSSHLKSVNLIGKFYANQNYNCNKKLFRKWMVNNAFAGYGENLYYKVPKNGTYMVCLVLYDSCNKCDTSICKTIQVNCGRLSLDAVTETTNIQLYPNPAQDLVNITFSRQDIQDVQMSILDLSGRVIQVRDVTVDNGSSTIDMQQLPPGVYLIRVNLDQQVYHLRLIKN